MIAPLPPDGERPRITAEDITVLQQLRRAALDLDLAIAHAADVDQRTGDLDTALDEVIEKSAALSIAIKHEVIQAALVEVLNDLCPHEWDEIVDGRPDYKIQRCMICNLEKAIDLHTGKETYITP